MKNSEALSLYNAIGVYKGDKDIPSKFSWAVMRTMKLIEASLIVTLNEHLKATEKFMAYESRRLLICKDAAMKDAEGNPVTKGEEFVFPNDTLPKELEDLNKEFAEEIEARKAQVERANEYLKEEYDGGVYKCKLSVLETLQLSPDYLAVIDPMIIDDSEPSK